MMTIGLHKAFRSALLAAVLLVLFGLGTVALAQPSAGQSPAGAQASPDLSGEGQASTVPEVVDEDFVIASLLISDPGGALYSRLGHAALRMQCPQFDLDYVFTYEAEDILKRPFAFLAGRLKMGLAAIAPEDYLNGYSTHGRGVKEYTLNIPVEAKRNLWRVLDDHLMEGMELKFDYLRRGCANSTLMFLKEGLDGVRIGESPDEIRLEFHQWPEHFKGASRREITYEHLKGDKWTTFLMHFICNGIIDKLGCSNEQKTIIPADLPFILSNATINGVPVIDSEPQEVLPSIWYPKQSWFTPMLAAILLLVLAIVCTLLKIKALDYVLLGIQTLLGIIAVFLLFSPLVCTEWSWLIIPFNPLPAIFWKWRRHWALPYAIVLLVWAGFMFFWPHLLTDGAYIVIALCLAANHLTQHIESKSPENSI